MDDKFSENKREKLKALEESGTVYQYRGYEQTRQEAPRAEAGPQEIPESPASAGQSEAPETRVTPVAPAYDAAAQAVYGSYGGAQEAPASDAAAQAVYGSYGGAQETPAFDTAAQAGYGSYGGAQETPASDAATQAGYAAYAGTAPSAAREPRVYGLRRSVIVAFIIISVCAVAVAAIGGGLIGAAVSGRPAAVSPGGGITITPSEDLGTTEAVAQKVLDSVVGIKMTMRTQSYFGQSGEATGEGSGIIVHSDGYILTNSHVIGDGAATSIAVLLPTGKEAQAKLLWNDDAIDLAVLKVDEAGLTPVEFGDSDKVRIGSYVAAIGNPLGFEFSGSITQGVVSGLNRSIIASSETKTTRMEGLIQVDAAINPGNSGGPLLNAEGHVIGINTAKASAEGMGFAIPVNTVKPIVEKVIKTGNFERAYMGVTTSNAADIAEQYPELKLGVDTGAFINEVTISSPADKAGLIMKDVIIAVNGKKIETSTELIKELLNYSAGETVKITYVRDGKEYEVDIKLAPQSEVYGTPQQDSEAGSDGSQAPENGSGSDDPFDGFFDW
ncbi:MAG: trypsin-like peptidase domain-containing protein [Clostridiales Family XIII bacterium]|jgi:S1-C subfamily serine protease|nr:trypsin-like peptidase domain-containing protein [Clostridiales Family XIII bacterium]